MAASGRPTPQVVEDKWPRYEDKAVEAFRHSDINPYLIQHRAFGLPLLPGSEAWPLRDRWAEHFGREAPLHLEIGSGNGFFLTELAERQPDWNLVGLEIRYKRVVLCAMKLRKAGVTHARIVRYHAGYLDDLFRPGSLDGLYVNHPDPWPKEKHEKNRLISRWFLEDAARLLKPGARFRLKSDFHDNIDRLPRLLAADGDGNPLPALPFRVLGVSHDVDGVGAPWPADIETLYHRKMRRLGYKIAAIEVERTEGEWSPSAS